MDQRFIIYWRDKKKYLLSYIYYIASEKNEIHFEGGKYMRWISNCQTCFHIMENLS